MGLARTWAVSLLGLTGHLVEVEAHISQGLPAFALVGLPDTAVNEARERVRAAVTSCGITWPAQRTTVNLSPASLPKSGTGLDLALAIAVLVAGGLPARDRAARTVHLGELGLDGRLHPVRGILPAVAAAVAAGRTEVVVPAGSAAEARLVPGAEVHAIEHLSELVVAYGGEAFRPDSAPVDLVRPVPAETVTEPDLRDVRGQEEARFALEVAAAGAHHLFLQGSPGTGKTMLAARLPGLLPDLPESDAVEVSAVHSISGTLDAATGLLRRPPFEDPHHTATVAAVVGGGSGFPRPGAVSRAHRGVLLLDEAPEFAPRVLQTLRQPLEHGELVLQRATGSARYPARFQLVLAANPCPCGKASGKGLACSCSPMDRRRYLGRLSGPLLDRIDLQVDVPPVTRASLAIADAPEPSAVVAARVASARRRQHRRLAGTGWRTNAEVPGAWLRSDEGGLPAEVRVALERALDRGALSMRGLDRVLRVSWTLADLAGQDRPTVTDVGTALALRTRGSSDA
ncbi:YifB family Mg chelatase-like AAA ATPase [Georgenia halophila]|uniref:YifB family Mg chelatase-like AAA ATPase n=1 Tax=Georgenia halophila TaxID=620889 RepID=A0ABP8L6L8_9MICO